MRGGVKKTIPVLMTLTLTKSQDTCCCCPLLALCIAAAAAASFPSPGRCHAPLVHGFPSGPLPLACFLSLHRVLSPLNLDSYISLPCMCYALLPLFPVSFCYFSKYCTFFFIFFFISVFLFVVHTRFLLISVHLFIYLHAFVLMFVCFAFCIPTFPYFNVCFHVYFSPFLFPFSNPYYIRYLYMSLHTLPLYVLALDVFLYLFITFV